jgi:LPS-assembly protein
VLSALLLAASGNAQTPPKPAEPPPAVPPASLKRNEWNIVGDVEEIEGTVRRVKGHPAEVETPKMLFRADEIEYDEDSGDVKASGHVYFKHFLKNEQIWGSRLEYNTEEETGKFYDVIGETLPRIVVRPGVLPGNTPFHFEGEWAERVGDRYFLYNGWVTNCKLPNPWWRLRGPRFEIVPDEKAVSHNSLFLVRRMPLFYTPFFYHSLAKNPRKSGFLMPNLVPRSKRGFMVGLGYYWAIARDYDLTYRLQDFTTHAFTHHVDFRAKPREGTDLDFILYGVQDRGQPQPNNAPPPTYSGISLYAVGRSDLGNGWSARGYLNYISSFRFRNQWSESYTEAITSETHSIGSIGKNWSTYSFNAVVQRLENFQSNEIQITDPVSGAARFETNAVNIRKLPEAQFTERDRKLFGRFPLWFSFDSAAGLLYKSAPVFDGSTLLYRFQTNQFTNRMHLAPHLTTALHFGDFHIVPSVGIIETFYGEGQAHIDGVTHTVGTNIVRSARDLSVDFIFPTLARVFDKKTVFGDKLKHVIEPRATYRYVTGVGADANRFIRFDERDLVTNTNEMLLSLTNRVYAKRGDSVEEIFTWELLQKRYFDPTFGGALLPGVRNIFEATADTTAYAFLVGPRSASPIVSTMHASPVGGIGFQWQTDYDTRTRSMVDSNLSVDYRRGKYFVSAGHNEVHTVAPEILSPSANQFTGRVDYGDANRRGLNAGFIAVYDYRKGYMLYSTAQVTYNTDCCGFSVQYGRFGFRSEQVVRIAFSIANVGSFGTLRKQDRLF